MEKQQIADFMRSLGRAEFDFENDNDLDEFDYFFIFPDFQGPGTAYTPDDAAAISDVDCDGDFDMRDWAVLQQAYTGQVL